MSDPAMKKWGGPAFPFVFDPSIPEQKLFTGMSLRDWFAGQSLAGYRSNPDNHLASSKMLAQWSYADADAMLAQCEKGEGDG